MSRDLRALLVVGSLLAASLSAQSTSADDWPEAVAKAVEHRRYAVRRAVAGKIARAGDAAVPALRAWAEEHGDASVPLTLVDAIARADTTGEATVALLRDWALDREFYWRSQALDGLARRELEDCLPVFRNAISDASHLYRIAGARGLTAVGTPADRERTRSLLVDPDPRVRLRTALVLLERDDSSGLAAIVSALLRKARFLDDPWGERDALFARNELKRIRGVAFDLPSTDATVRSAAEAAVLEWAKAQSGGDVPALDLDPPAVAAAGGLEIRSCRNGDLFVRWSENGDVWFGLDPITAVRLVSDQKHHIASERVAIPGTAIHGKVVCDYVRVWIRDPAAHHKAAPEALPKELAGRLLAIVTALAESGHADHAKRLETRLRQFVAAAEK